MMDGWTFEKTIELIKEYRNAPELWNSTLDIYKDNGLRTETLNRLSTKFDQSVKNVRSKIKNLRTTFHRQHKKLVLLKASGGSPSQSKRSVWFGYEPLKFLLSTKVENEDVEFDDESEDLFTAESPELVECSVDYYPDQFVLPVEQNQCQSVVPVEQNQYQSVGTRDGNMNHGKWKKRKFNFQEERMKESYKMYESARNRDEFSVFGEYVANELRKFSTRAQTLAKHNINNILFEGNMGNYDSPSANELFNVNK